MKIWEIINFSDPVTILCDDFDYAVAAALSLGEGGYGLKECPEGREMPPFVFCKLEVITDWLRGSFPEKHLPSSQSNPEAVLSTFLDPLDKFRLAEILRSTQVCSYEERNAYQKALEMIGDGAKKQEYAKWWKEERRSSMNDIARYGWQLADQLEKTARFQEAQKQNLH